MPGPSACSAVGACGGVQPAGGWGRCCSTGHVMGAGDPRAGAGFRWERAPFRNGPWWFWVGGCQAHPARAAEPGVSPCRQHPCARDRVTPVASSPPAVACPGGWRLRNSISGLWTGGRSKGDGRGEQQSARTPGVIFARLLRLLGWQPASPTALRGWSRTPTPSSPPNSITASSGLGKPGREGSPARPRGLSCTALQPSVKWAEKKRDSVMFPGPGAEAICPPRWPRSPPRLQSGAGCG